MFTFVLCFGANYVTAVIFIVGVSVAEAMYAPAVLEYNMRVAPKGREGMYAQRLHCLLDRTHQLTPCHGGGFLFLVVLQRQQLRRHCSHAHVCRKTGGRLDVRRHYGRVLSKGWLCAVLCVYVCVCGCPCCLHG